MLLQLAVLYVIVALASVVTPDRFLMRNPSTLILMVLAIFLTIFFENHIIERGARVYLVAIAVLITAWIVLRGAKYIAFEETEFIARHIWYLYYIPALFISLFSLLAALSVGEAGMRKPCRSAVLSALVTFVLGLLVLSNDLHQLVFVFHPGFANWDSDYSHGPVFYLIYGWIALLFVGAICILFSKCRVSSARALVWIPILPALFGAIYMSLYASGLWLRINGRLFAVCFTIAGIWLSLIYIGLIPSNLGYAELFENSSLAAQIADLDHHIVYKSPESKVLTDAEPCLETDVSPDADTRIHCRPVHGGFVYWQDDITELNRINEELRELGERLGEEAELLRLENELKEERAQIEAKTKTYDEISERVSEQSARISELCTYVSRNSENYAVQMRTVCLLAAYIKRFANLSLLTADTSSIEIGELYLAVQESLRYVSYMGIPAECTAFGEGEVDAKGVLEAYELFEQLLEQALPSLRGVQVSVYDNEIKAVFEGVMLTLPSGYGASLTVEDNNSFVHMTLREAGETV